MTDLSSLGKWFLLLGGLLALLGILLILVGKVHFLGRLPGDIRIEREGFSFYFPVVTCLVLSVGVSFLFWAFSRFK